ncbi:MAG TPA: TadE/TadG family type IV pilus assembly protein [Vicinamibacterales bacterium]|nr:TadE/TadG family type IV pilus assembly protein [Vicinamibacterales bacterium]
MRGSREGRDNERGAELIELAIVLPILLLCFAAILDFGFLFQRYEAITNAAREGARIATLPNYNSTDVQSRITSYLAASGLSMSGVPAPYVSQTATRLMPNGQTISVSEVVVWYPAGMTYLGPIAGLIGASGHGSLMLRATSVMRNEVAAGGS